MSSTSLRFVLLLALPLSACSRSNDGVGTSADLAGTSSTGDTPDFAELNTPAICTSGTMWTQGDRGSSRMHPGVACIDCHDSNNGPSLSFAGTVFPSAHEPDDCNGSSSSISVVITGADGASITISTNTSGNFYTTKSVALPFTAKVTSGGNERAMVTPQMVGDCNSCHTQTGDNLAPGRIVAP